MAQVSATPMKPGAKAPAPRRSPIGWVLGWVVAPALFLGLIFGAKRLRRRQPPRELGAPRGPLDRRPLRLSA
ncbi:MAG: hypothetical protein IPK80_18935 [Nannocystis sp.]|nr:hypothetical protein [Nannocystis sp.]